MPFEPAEAQVAVTDVVQPRIEIVMESGTEVPGQTAVPPHQPDVDAFFANEPCDANAFAAWMSLWAGTLLLNDILKDGPAADDKRKLKVQHGDCDCC